jgi:hypothetical protein
VCADYSLVRISPHAERQMAKRRIPEIAVRAVLANPDRVLPGDCLGRRVLYQRAYELTFVVQGWMQSERIRPGSATRRLQAVQQASTMAR